MDLFEQFTILFAFIGVIATGWIFTMCVVYGIKVYRGSRR